MHDGMGAELLSQPDIEGEIAVWRDQIRVVIARRRVDIVAARGLNADEHVAETEHGKPEGIAGDERIALGRAPALLDLGTDSLRELCKSRLVVGEGQQRTALAGGPVREIIRRPDGESADQGIAVDRDIAHAIPGLGQCAQHGDGPGRCVQPDAVAEPPVLVRVIGKNDRPLAFFRFGAAQMCP